MKKLIYSIALFFFTVSFISCEKGLMNFDAETADVYFSEAGRNIPALAYDSLYVSLAYSKAPDSIRNVVVAVTGPPVDHDRAYGIQINDTSTAIAGVHYELLTKEFVIQKNRLSDTIQVKLLRTADMQTESFELMFDLLPNENFGTDWKTRIIGGKPIKTIKTKIRYNDIVRKPGRWLDSYWGTFTRKKLFYVCEFLEITPQYMDTDMTVAENTVLPKIVQRHLNKENLAGRTVYEDDNITPMRMGNSAQ